MDLLELAECTSRCQKNYLDDFSPMRIDYLNFLRINSDREDGLDQLFRFFKLFSDIRYLRLAGISTTAYEGTGSTESIVTRIVKEFPSGWDTQPESIVLASPHSIGSGSVAHFLVKTKAHKKLTRLDICCYNREQVEPLRAFITAARDTLEHLSLDV